MVRTAPGPGRIVLAAGATVAAVAAMLAHSTVPLPRSPSLVATGTTGTPGTPDPTGTTASGTSYDGTVAQTRWGPVQVRITVSGGKVVGAAVLQVPNGNMRDQQINSYAVPILNSEAVQSGTAQIDTVSGATVTSLGYISSLQAALDAAGR